MSGCLAGGCPLHRRAGVRPPRAAESLGWHPGREPGRSTTKPPPELPHKHGIARRSTRFLLAPQAPAGPRAARPLPLQQPALAIPTPAPHVAHTNAPPTPSTLTRQSIPPSLARPRSLSSSSLRVPLRPLSCTLFCRCHGRACPVTSLHSAPACIALHCSCPAR